MNPSELKAAIKRTKAEIYQGKRQIEEATDPQEKRQLKRWLKNCNTCSSGTWISWGESSVNPAWPGLIIKQAPQAMAGFLYFRVAIHFKWL